jgi:hypothetical protein
MKFACPHCTQKFEIADEWAGHALDCPNCQGTFTVPSSPGVSVLEVIPHAPAQPLPFKVRALKPSHSAPSKPQRRGAGKFVLALILLTAAGFGYVMIQSNKPSQQQAPKGPVDAVEESATSTPAPAPEPTVTDIGAATVPAEAEKQTEPPPSKAVGENTPAPALVEETNPDAVTAEPETPASAADTVSSPPQPTTSIGAVAFPTPRFTSPGVLWTRQDLEILKANLKREPWKSGFEALSNEGRSKLTYKMAGPFKEVKRAPNANLWPWRGDMIAIWNLSRMWYFTGDNAYAQKAHDILLAWATTHTEFGGRESMLDLGDYAYMFVGGADILRGTWPGWTKADTAAVKKYFNDVLIPASNPYGESQFGAANKGALALCAKGLMAIFNEDTATLKTVVYQIRTLAHIGLRSSNDIGMLGDYLRDQGHAHGQLVSLAMLAEALWKQGIDIYSDYDNRLLAAGEYFARVNSLIPTPFLPFGTTDAYYIADRTNHGWGGGNIAINLIHGAYVVRKDLPAPYTSRKRQAMPVDGGSFMFLKEVDRSVATPLLPPPIPATTPVTSGFSNVEIGGATPTGGATYAGGTWKVRGGGSDMWKTADSCHFTYKAMTGDCAIIAKVESVQNTSPSAKAGVMMRTSLSEGAPRAWMAVTPKVQFEQNIQGLAVYGGTNYSNRAYNIPSSSYWVKLERLGNIITGYVSPDGTNWAATDVGRIGAPVPSTIYVGLVVCSTANGTLNTSTFSTVQITGGNGGAPVVTPAAPATLLAAPGNNIVPLRWQPSFGATSYTIRRATNSGGPYTTVASGITASSFTDTTATNGTTYYYVAHAINSAGASPASPEDSATPKAPRWNVTFGGTATATAGAEGAGKAFDSNSHTMWFAGGKSTGALQYDFGSTRAPVIKGYTVTSPHFKPERDPKDWEFQGSNDGTNWTTLDTQSGQTFPSRFYEIEYALAKPAVYRHIRLNVTANNGDKDLHIADIKLLSDTWMSNARIPSLIHWKTNGAADRERAIASQKAAESQK